MRDGIFIAAVAPPLPAVPALLMRMRSLVPMAVPITAVLILMRSPAPMAVSMAIPIVVIVMVMSPGLIRIPVRAVIPCARDHDRCRGNYNWRRNPDTHGHAYSGVGQER
jgi:hypothetical protein